MKYLLVLLVLVVAIGVWRSGRRRAEREAPPAPAGKPLGAPTEMLSCRQCGVHLPSADVVQGRSGAYCSVEHRRLGEG